MYIFKFNDHFQEKISNKQYVETAHFAFWVLLALVLNQVIAIERIIATERNIPRVHNLLS